jgi:hypothetical protein
MAITDIQISEELETNAPSIKYRGNEGPKSPQEMEMMMSGGQPLPEDPTKPINPFAPKPTGPVLPNKMAFDDTPAFELEELKLLIEEFERDNDRKPTSIDDLKRYFYIKYGKDRLSEVEETVSDRQMAAYGGIMGMDGRKQYGIGSWFQKAKDKVVDDLIPNEIKENPLLTAALVAGGNELLPGGADRRQSVIDALISAKDYTMDKIGSITGIETGDDRTLGGDILSGIAKNIVPIVGGIGAGLFTKNTESNTPGLPDDTTGINLADYKKAANLLDQKQGLAANMNFLPTVASRKYSPEEMAITYAQAVANGGRIGMAEGGLMNLGGMEKDYRAEGGFVPIGKEEKADDVPARLSVNEFVFTADAVRNAGGGDIDQGAQVMENMMKHLEAGGQVSEESQGMTGARDMFATSQRLGDVI